MNHAASARYYAFSRLTLAVLGIEEMGNSPQEFAAAIKRETPKWAKIIRAAGIKAD